MEEYGIMEVLELTVTRCGRWTGNRIYLEWPKALKAFYLFIIFYLIHPNRKGWHQKARPARGCVGVEESLSYPCVYACTVYFVLVIKTFILPTMC